MNRNYSIFVNTTDSFEDCWIPFFILFKKFWPNYNGKIYLNTETKNFSMSGLDIICVKNGQKQWSECVRYAINSIDSDIILYLQEDYFLKDYVKSEELDKLVSLMNNTNIDCLHLTDQHGGYPYHTTEFENIVEIDQKSNDRLSCQAAFWKKDVLLKYLYPNESGWHFETYGTMRSHYMKDRFCAVDHNVVQLNKFEIIPYIFTGIVKGQWWHEVETLFATNGIHLNLMIRGFYSDPLPLSFKLRMIKKLQRLPKFLNTKLQIIVIRLNNYINNK